MIIEVKDENEFKVLCHNAWIKNSEIWINSRTLPVRLKQSLLNFLFTSNNPNILDIGCGNGWLLQEILDAKSYSLFNYIGIDINNAFIDHLNKKYSDPRIDFLVADFEANLSGVSNHSIDKAIAVLSLIEMSNLEMAFTNINNKLKPGGSCIIVVLNPILEMIRLNSNLDELKKDIVNFRDDKLFYYEKKIVSKTVESEVNYYGLLHHIGNYFSAAKKSGLLINDFKEIDGIKELGQESTIYQCIEFTKAHIND